MFLVEEIVISYALRKLHKGFQQPLEIHKQAHQHLDCLQHQFLLHQYRLKDERLHAGGRNFHHSHHGPVTLKCVTISSHFFNCVTSGT